ncbi:MAG: branched-chain amino acid ABC transporter permease [Burkholderiaceae bacterium]
MPSLSLLGQALVSGLLAGGLYGLLGLGLSLSWGLLRLVNLAHFALAFLGAYVTFQLGNVWHLSIAAAIAVILPSFFLFGMALHAMFRRFAVNEFGSLLVTFGVAVIIESAIQVIWTADFRRFESPWNSVSYKIGAIYVPLLELMAFLTAAALAALTWTWLTRTYVGKGLRASAEDAQIAAAFGVDHARQSYILSGLCAMIAGVAGVFVALISTLAPSQIWAWLGVVFAVVIIGRLGNPVGALLAGMLIGACEGVAMAVISPAWSPMIAFSVLIAILLWQPKWL